MTASPPAYACILPGAHQQDDDCPDDVQEDIALTDETQFTDRFIVKDELMTSSSKSLVTSSCNSTTVSGTSGGGSLLDGGDVVSNGYGGITFDISATDSVIDKIEQSSDLTRILSESGK